MGVLDKKWKIVKTELPPEGKWVYLWPIQKRARYFDGDWELSNGDWVMARHITHWRELPKGPNNIAG